MTIYCYSLSSLSPSHQDRTEAQAGQYSDNKIIKIHTRKYTKSRMRKKTFTNLLLICLGSFVTGVSLTLITPFYPTEALSKVNTRESTVCHQVLPGGHSDAVGHCSQYGLHSHCGLHSSVWKGIEFYHIHSLFI